MSKVRVFESGATRDTDEGKLDYEGFLSPLVLEKYAEYMHRNRTLPDGSLRAGDNWQAGMPVSELMKSNTRHYMELWKAHRTTGVHTPEAMDAAMGVLFNTQAIILEILKGDGADGGG